MAAKKSRNVRRSRRADLDVQISFFEGLAARDGEWVELLQALAECYSEQGRYADTVRMDERLLRLRPDDLDVRVNLALSLTQDGQIERAILELGNAVDLGYCDAEWLAENPSLEALRKHPGYKRLRAKMRSKLKRAV